MTHKLEIIEHPNIKNMKLSLVDIAYHSPHFHSETEILLVLEGNPRLIINSEALDFQPGDIILINGNEGHEIISTEHPSTFLSLQLLPQYFEGYFPNMKHTVFKSHCSHKIQHYLLILTFLQLAKIYITKPLYYEIQCASLVNIMYFDLLTKYAHYEISETTYLTKYQKGVRLSRIISYIEKHYAEKITLQDIATEEGLSVSFLSHFIRDNLNRNFQDYLTFVRFNHAKELILTTDMKLIDICYTCGFSDYRYMTQAFNRYCHCTPKQFKQQSSVIIPIQRSINGSLENFYASEDALSKIIAAMQFYNQKLNRDTNAYTIFD